jgi:signal transduction histidine kinase
MRPRVRAIADARIDRDAAARPGAPGDAIAADGSDRERSLLHAAVKEAHERALASSRAKCEFLATMSHEMRTPLNAVLGYAELLELELPGSLNDAQHSYVERIRDASARLLSLINDTLDLAKLDAGRLVLERARFDARSMIDAAIAHVAPIAEARGVRVAVRNDGEPELFADRRRAEQIVSQLLSNAVRFSEAGREVIVSASRFGAPETGDFGDASSCWCAIRVEDSGVGIGERDLDAIFQPFTQVDASLTRGAEGTGLGLTIVRRLARLMGGDLSVTSRLGAGSVFTLWLPAPAMIEANGELADCGTRERRGGSRSARGLADVAEAILADLDGLMDRFVARLRQDEQLATVAARLERHVLEDHAASFLANIAQSLAVIDGAQGDSAPLMRDATDIQLLIADRHGAYRQRTGWTEEELEREHDLMLETVEESVRTRLPATAEFPPDSIDTALGLVRRFVERAREQGLRAYRRAAIGVVADIPTDGASTATTGASSTSTRLS